MEHFNWLELKSYFKLFFSSPKYRASEQTRPAYLHGEAPSLSITLAPGWAFIYKRVAVLLGYFYKPKDKEQNISEAD